MKPELDTEWAAAVIVTAAAAAYFDVPATKLFSPHDGKDGPVTAARNVAMALVYGTTGMTRDRVSKFFGRSHGNAVRHAQRRVEEEFHRHAEEIKASLRRATGAVSC